MAESIITRKGGGEDLPQTELPVINFISKTDNSLTFTIENTDEEKAIVYYELDDETPDANSINLNGNTTTSNLTFTGLTPNTSYTLHVWATAFGKKVSQVADYLQTTTITTPNPTLTYVSKTWDTITLKVTNNDNVSSNIFYQINVTPPVSNSVTLAAGATSDDLIIGDLTKTTNYTVYAQAETPGKLKSEIMSFSQTTLDWDTLTAPTLTFVSAALNSITFTVSNTNNISTNIYYGTSTNPNTDFVTVAANTTSSNITLSGLVENTTYTIYAISKQTNYYNSSQTSSSMKTASVVGQALFASPGNFNWIAPAGVTKVSVVAIGAGGQGDSSGSVRGGGGGGGLGWKNNITVVPGQSYAVQVGLPNTNKTSPDTRHSFFINYSTVVGYGGNTNDVNSNGGTGGGFVGDGGGNGGTGGNGVTNYPAGGGGAGGYSGNGGNGGTGGNNGSNGSGGGGGGGASDNSPGTNNNGGGQSASNCTYAQVGYNYGGKGGNTGLFGQGINGNGGVQVTLAYGSAVGGSGETGSPASTTAGGGGPKAQQNFVRYFYLEYIEAYDEYYGGYYYYTECREQTVNYSISNMTPGNNGGLRIIWGDNRAFPSTNTGNL
jgi:hypothetical protein